MKKATRPVEQSRPCKSDHITDLLSSGRIYYHPEGGTVELLKSMRDITVTSEDGDSVSLSIGPLGCIALGKALQAEGHTWLAECEAAETASTPTDKAAPVLALVPKAEGRSNG